MENCFVRSLKRMVKKIITLAVIILIIIGIVKLYKYLHVGYYIRNMKVTVDVTSRKEYKVTEVIDAHFNVSKPGITRVISSDVSKGDFAIKDVSVEGEKYNSDIKKYQGATVKIGDKNKKVSGDKKYVIHYTLFHYDDFDNTDKNFYLNILENNHEAKVENFTAEVKFPKGFKPVNTKADMYRTDTNYKYIYAKDKSPVKCDFHGNDIVLKCSEPITEGVGICLKTVLDKNYFKNIPPEPNNETTFMGSSYEEKEYKPNSFGRDSLVNFVKSYPEIIAFPALVLVGVLLEISKKNRIERERAENLRRLHNNPDSWYNICFINNDGEDCCCGSGYDDDRQ